MSIEGVGRNVQAGRGSARDPAIAPAPATHFAAAGDAP